MLRTTLFAILLVFATGLLVYLEPYSPNFGGSLKRPERVGIAYPVDPLPLASFDGVLGTKPRLEDLNLYVNSFARVVLMPEGYVRYPWILKWGERPLVALRGPFEDRHRFLLAEVVNFLSRVTGLPTLVVEVEDESALLEHISIILFDDLGDSSATRCGLFQPFQNDDGTLAAQQMLVSLSIDGRDLVGCFYEDISVG